MKHYIDQNGVVYAYETNGSQDHLIRGKTPIEGDALVAALAAFAKKVEAEVEARKNAQPR